jgi:uncharacterized protein (DUF305 family)
VLGVAVALVFLLLASTVSVPARAQMGPMAGPPLDQLTGDDFDQAFLQQMTMHHAMAVMMARPAVANAGHQEVKALAQAMIDDQTKEIAQMRTWAKDWYGLDIPDQVAMMDQMMGPGQAMPGTGQGSAHHPGMPMNQSGGMPMMPGMPMYQSSDMPMMHGMSMMSDLWKLPPERLDAVFMAMMIPHHQGAIDMANLALDRAAHSELKELATTVIESQRSEIDQMNGWLASWYSL